MDKEISLTLEWTEEPQNTYVYNSLDHLLRDQNLIEDQNQHNIIIIKQEPEFFTNTINTQSIQNLCTVRLNEISSKENGEARQQNNHSNVTEKSSQTDIPSKLSVVPLKKLTELPENLYNTGRIDVTEMSVDSSGYKYIFIYEDQHSKFITLKALRSDTAQEVATRLLDVLAILGAPRVLQSGNGRKFAEQVVHELRTLWNDFFISHEDARCEVSCKDFKDSLESWMKKNPTRTWREGLNFVQILHNTTYRCKDGKVPYEILFERNVYDNFPDLRTGTNMKDLNTEEMLTECSLNRGDDDTIATVKEDTQNTSDDDNVQITDEKENSKYRITSDEKNEKAQSAQNQDKSTKSNDVNELKIMDDDNVQITNEKENNKYRITNDEENENTQSAQNQDKSTKNNDVDELKMTCKYCNKQYTKLGALENHMVHHQSEEVLRCKLCCKKFSSEKLYNSHMERCGKPPKVRVNRRKIHRKQSNKKDDARIKHKKQELLDQMKSVIKYAVKRKRHDMSSLDAKDSCPKTVKNLNSSDQQKWPVMQCRYCKEKFKFLSSYEVHLRSHSNERPYVCDMCNRSFKQPHHLSSHLLTHINNRSCTCYVCNAKFDSMKTLKKHIFSHPQLPEVFDMFDCRLFQCDFCKKVLTSKKWLERHINKHMRRFECKECNRRFKQAAHLKTHMLVHSEARRFQCTVCFKRFRLPNSLKKHMYTHSGVKPFQCDLCGARFLEKRNLNGHLLTHSNERPYCCKICGKSYTLADTLRRHVSAAHEHGRTYQCEICAKMFKQLAHLSVHKRVHNDDRPFQCHICEKNFKHKNVLKSHLAIHSNIRPFECDACKATFIRKTNLQTHISSAHMNERPYTCAICDKRFKQISHLNGHLIVHSNIMPYKCKYCDRRCNRLDNLKKHMRLHTKKEIENAELEAGMQEGLCE